MAVVWAARSPVTASDVLERMEYSNRLSRSSVACALLALSRKGLASRARRDGRSWLYEPARPLAEHLGTVIADLLAASPDRRVTLRAALRRRLGAGPGVLAGADVETLRRFAAVVVVVDKRDGFRTAARACWRAEADADGQEVRAARCRGAAVAYAAAAEGLDEAITATGQ